MTVAEYIVDRLIQFGVTDAFGIPGGVVLELLYAMEDRKNELTPHLSYHEQMAGFAACGYAQASGKLGVAYATRGPGITNMITCMAEAYQESIAVLFITAHGHRSEKGMRFGENQELDIVGAVSGFVKYASNIETLEDVVSGLKIACEIAMKGRKGPVVLDFASKLFGQEVPESNRFVYECDVEDYGKDQSSEIIRKIGEKLSYVQRPIVLIGDGIRAACAGWKCIKTIEKLGCPILSSRASQDLAAQSKFYYGYIGSHGVRYSNFILSKADLIIAIGNRLAFPKESESFAPIVKETAMIRLDIDEKEFASGFDDSLDFKIDVRDFIEELSKEIYFFDRNNDWINICNILQKRLSSCDISEPVTDLIEILEEQHKECLYVCDVGNNEFWFARAYESVKPKGGVLYSKSYGTLGSALGRSIGAYFAVGKDIICIIGDQGFQYNIQELQFISYWNLPIGIILLNNAASGMISDQEKKKYGNRLVHVTEETGYGTPDFKKVANGYGIEYISCRNELLINLKDIDKKGIRKPFIYEIKFDRNISLTLGLPRGNVCQDMFPLLDRGLYNWLDKL